MKQQSLEASGFEKYRKKTRKEIFLEQMNGILPWAELCQAIEPSYPKASRLGGRPTNGGERRVYGDSAYTGQKSQIQATAEEAKDFTHKRGRRNHPLTGKERQSNRNKSKIRPGVEHRFGVIKHQFGYRKVRYKGLAKNAQAVFTKCALANLIMAKRHLLAI